MKTTTTVTIRLNADLLERIDAVADNRSKFFCEAAIEKLNPVKLDAELTDQEKRNVIKGAKNLSDMMQDLQSRLDTKAFEAARLYYHMEDYLAARVAFRNVLKDNSENMFREEILYYTAMASYKYARLSVLGKQKERYLVFIDDYLNFIGEMPDSPYRKELDVLYKRAQRALGREAVIDADIDMKEKAFAKERKEMEKALKQQAKKKKAEERRKKN